MGKFAVSKAWHRNIAVGDIVLVSFPFSDLKGQKVRPALVVAKAEFNDLILCQITSKPYSSKIAIRLEPADFKLGNLPVVSFVRPDKLFTADQTIVGGIAGKLRKTTSSKVLRKIRSLFAV